MNETFKIGLVTGVEAKNVKVQLYDTSSQLTYFYNGEKYLAPHLDQYIKTKYGNYYLVLKIESEEIISNDNSKGVINFSTFSTENHKIYKILNCKTLGYFNNDKFIFGIKYSPILLNEVFVISKKEAQRIENSAPDGNQSPLKNQNRYIEVGETLISESKYFLPINDIFNAHIGIFGNTGSGKSNTLTKLYSELFNQFDTPNLNTHIFDFNGEYTEIKFNKNTKVYEFNNLQKPDKFIIKDEEFWNEDLLSIMYDATNKTQKPFLSRIIHNRNKYNKKNPENPSENIKKESALEKYIERVLYLFCNQETHSQELGTLIRDNLFEKLNELLEIKLTWNKKIEYWGVRSVFFIKKEKTKEEYDLKKADLLEYFNYSSNLFERTKISAFDELEIRVILNLISSIINKNNRYDDIFPLLTRIKSNYNYKNVIEVADELTINNGEGNECELKIYNFKNCSDTIKKTLPLIISKTLYKDTKAINSNEKAQVVQLIIDEAHNILSNISISETEKWKDYRLEHFEEIIKEGRKFGFFLTVSSQRPGDISKTIISQIHNFFIHRLVNDNDINLLKNSISTLSAKEFAHIPYLSVGSCIVCGNAFNIPQIVSINELEMEQKPDSDNIQISILQKE
ncbi:MAG: ATP-binding protein [Mycoplasmatales bacterium]